MQATRAGDFAAAWRLADADLARPRPADAFSRPRHEQRIRDGRPIDGRRVLVRCDHRLGDMVQSARFLSAGVGSAHREAAGQPATAGRLGDVA
jgi:hypothetical protein